jgi:CHASE2 domain-containing sensor protein/tRNA A-37 threonylcarbamoyl transferase component Bud32
MVRKLLPLSLAGILAVGHCALSLGVLPQDALFGRVLKLKGEEPPSSRVVLVAIDASSLDAVGAWPWNSGKIRELVQAVSKWNPRGIVVTQEILKVSSDPVLWKDLAKSSSSTLVLPLQAGGDTTCVRSGATLSEPDIPRVALGGIAGLCSESILWGVDSLWSDPSRPVVPLVFRSPSDQAIPALAVASAQAAMPESGTWWLNGNIQVGATRKVSQDGSILASLSGSSSVAHVSASELLKGQVVGDLFKGKIVILGVTAAGIEPVFEGAGRKGASSGRMPKSAFLAEVVGGLLEGAHYPISRHGVAFNLLWLAASAAIVALAPLRQRRRFGLTACAALAGAGIAAFLFELMVLHEWMNPLPGVIYPALAAGVVLAWPRRKARVSEPSRMNPVRMPRSQESLERPTSTIPVTTVREATEVLEVARREEDRIERNERGEYVQIGRFVQLEPLGQGGMCTVFKAYDPKMERPVAIKILRADKTHTNVNEARFLREARVAGALHHSNINTLIEYGRAEDLWYLVLEFIDGQTLSQWIRENPGPRAASLVPWVSQIASALDLAHTHQVVHRDVKPSNFMIMKQSGVIKLMDFGVARTPDMTLNVAGTTVGTPNYMSPEQLQGSRVGPASDQYSLGVVVYQMLTQRVPFHGEGLTALCNNILKGNATALHTLRPDLPKALCDVVHKAFAVKPDDRFPNCSTFADSFAKVSQA